MNELDFGSTYTRRLPVYILVGCGDSMAGAPIQAVEQGIHLLRNELLEQPEAVEQLWISMITFATHARQVVPLTPIMRFSPPVLSAGGCYNLGAALRLLVQAVYRDIIPTTAEKKGDYKPLVFILFDNEPTDRWEMELAALQKAQREKKIGSIIALGCGDMVNTAVLRQITESVLLMSDVTPDTLRAFFKWTSASVSTVSSSVALPSSAEVVTLPSPPNGCQIVL
jgi:uncharacterized protein YegL